MLKIVQNVITLTRGDTARINLSITKNGASYDFSGDTVVFSVKHDVNTPDYVFQKPVIDGSITILPEDTEGLSYGNYVYDVQLTTPGGDICTVITPNRLTVAPEVTWSAVQGS